MVKTYVFYMYFVRWVCLHLMTLMEYVFNGVKMWIEEKLRVKLESDTFSTGYVFLAKSFEEKKSLRRNLFDIS